MSDHDHVGRYLRECRVQCSKSLRDVADELGVSHAYLGKIERGTKRLPKKYWKALEQIVPTVDVDELQTRAELDAPVRLELHATADAGLGLALARRMQKTELTDEQMQQILEIVRETDDSSST